MKAYVVFVQGHKTSESYMRYCMESCSVKGWDPEPLEGVTPATLSSYPDLPDAEGSRVQDFFREGKKVYNTKKACFNNHIRVWKKCIELNEPVAFIEQDADCIRPWGNETFDEVLILNIESAFRQKVFEHLASLGWIRGWNLGVNTYDESLIPYRHSNKSWKGSYMMPGTASYAITPKGANKLLKAVEKHGWEQSDFFINTKNVHIQYVVPEYFTFTLKNLNMSHGF